MVKERNFVVGIILSIITCGIYYIYWFVTLTDDVRVLNKNSSLSGVKSFLFTIITCGIYGFYWAYKMGKATYEIQASRGRPASDNSVLFVVLAIFGLQIVNVCIIQSEINDAAKIESV